MNTIIMHAINLLLKMIQLHVQKKRLGLSTKTLDLSMSLSPRLSVFCPLQSATTVAPLNGSIEVSYVHFMHVLELMGIVSA